MGEFSNLLMGFQIAITPFNLFIALVGIVLGTIIGVLPGLGGANGVAILLPITFTMPPTSAIIFLSCIYWGALFGGAITSILFNIPGEPWSVATTFIGFILAAVGLDIVTGKLRLSFASVELMRGFSFIVAVIGLFGIGEIFLTVEEGLRFRGEKARIGFREMVTTWRELGGYWRTFIRSALIGFWMGFKPGGATPASFMSYSFAKRFSKTPEKFGKGTSRGWWPRRPPLMPPAERPCSP